MNIFDNMRNNLNNFSDVPGGQTPLSSGTGAGMTPQVGNPMFRSQIDLKVSVQYGRSDFTVDGTNPKLKIFEASAPIVAASLPEPCKTPLPVYLFGNSDFAAQFARSSSLKRPENWTFLQAVVLSGKADAITVSPELSPAFFEGNQLFEIPSLASFTGKGKRGDIVLQFAYTVLPDGLTDLNLYTAEVIISCPQVAYSTLLDSLSSDTFSISGFRYTVQDVTKIAQFDNAVDLVTQSMFGKLATDSINPNSMKLPSNQQDNIIDIPLTYGFDKNKVIITEINYDCQAFTWSLFIPTVQKIKA